MYTVAEAQNERVVQVAVDEGDPAIIASAEYTARTYLLKELPSEIESKLCGPGSDAVLKKLRIWSLDPSVAFTFTEGSLAARRASKPPWRA